ncbi:hypothetical protein TNCV_5134271 [Trichonephila clavipes]|nr:hypothetical protein TNCV_5134271 [Trichonephila clavipes]
MVESFFKNDEGHNVTVNGDRYRAMITNFFIPELNNHDVEELWFQQDGATCHTARATIDLLKDTFGDRLISRFGPVNWPPRSCDLTPLDYFLWGYVNRVTKISIVEVTIPSITNLQRVWYGVVLERHGQFHSKLKLQSEKSKRMGSQTLVENDHVKIINIAENVHDIQLMNATSTTTLHQFSLKL